MTAPRPYDPWADVTTAGGLPADEVISLLQKSIRRSETRIAAMCAVEMSATSEGLDRYLWDRLHVIAVEDIGFGHPTVVTTIVALDAARTRFEPGSHDRLLFAIHAIRLLTQSRKDRSNDELATVLLLDHRDGVRPEIPDHALDMHTHRGREMGRDVEHFLNEGARIVPEMADRDRRWRDELRERLRLQPGPP